MGKLVGLLSSSIGLAFEASAAYQSSTKTKNAQGTRDTPNYPYYDSPYTTRDLNNTQARRDEKAFKELQNYADFQRVLSDRVSEDIINDQRYSPHDPTASINDGFEDYFSHQAFEHAALRQQTPQGRLPCPVIIPQRRPEDKSRGWVRAYAPDLMACGISQPTFLNFLDSFNEASKSSPYLNAVNVAAIGVGFAPGIAPMVISMAIPAAVGLAKRTQTEQQSNTFIARANAELFLPHGLFAMVMTYRPGQPSETSIVDTSQPPPSPNASFGLGEPQLPTGAPLIFPEDDALSPAQQGNSNKLRKIEHFIADYGDRRAQARYAQNNPSSHLLLGPTPTFVSSWSDPTHPSNSGGLVSFLSHSNSGTSGRTKESHRRRRRRGSSNTPTPTPTSPPRRNGLLATALGGANGTGRRDGGGRPSLIGGVRGMISGPGGKDQGLIKSIRKISMNSNVLYLMIVNNPDNDVLTVDDSDAYKDARAALPVRGARGLDREEHISRAGHGRLSTQGRGRDATLDRRLFDSEMEDRGPPPKYSTEVKGVYYDLRREQEYCVPTL